MFHELPLVVTIGKQADASSQGLQLARETPGFASQTFQVMTQVSIHCFHRIRFFLIRAHFVGCSIIQGVIEWKGIRVVLFGLWSAFQTGLHGFPTSRPHHIPTQQTMGLSIHNGQDVDFVFFCCTKVYISSNSAIRGFLGTFAGGNLLVQVWIQFATLCGLTCKILPIDRWLLPSIYIRMASIRVSEEQPCGKGSGVYTRLHSPQRYRWLPEGLNPALYCFWLAWHLGHFMLPFYSVSDFGHSLIMCLFRSL